MMTLNSAQRVEYEAKFLNADHDGVRSRLADKGGMCREPRRLMRRVNLDFADFRLKEEGAWVRLRDQGDGIITLAIKTEKSSRVDGVEEQEVIVGDFDAALAVLQRLGLVTKSYQETYRESWMLGDVEVELDQWPWIPPTVEIEGNSEAAVKAAAKKLELPWKTATFGSITSTYAHYFAVSDDDVNHHPEFRFSDKPPWPSRP